MLGIECVIISIEDARKLVNYLGCGKQTIESIKKLQDTGVYDIYDELTRDVKRYDEYGTEAT